MTNAPYLIGRKKWFRPQGMLWSDDPGTLVPTDPSNPAGGSRYVPTGYEKNSQKYVNSIVASTAQIISVTGSGPWTGTVISSNYIGNIEVGFPFTATNGTGSIGSGGTYVVSQVLGVNSFRFTATGGTTPTTGTITNIDFILTVSSVSGSGPWTATLSNVPNIENVLVGSTITATGITGSLGSGGLYTVSSVNTVANSLTFTATGGTLPLSGTIKTVAIEPTQDMLENSFIILSDHNRGEISISNQRIEQKQRMINGSMRSYHIADKININTSWNLLPSRSFAQNPEFNQTTGKSIYDALIEDQYTADNGAGGVEMLDWYESHKGPFWVFLSYDKYSNFDANNTQYVHLGEYSQILQMYISSFDYSIVKRGRANYDMWNISVSLEEV
jgi:hypothetical protein